MPREVYRLLKANFALGPVQTAVLVGTILGDANINLRKTDARLHIKHSLKQLSLVVYKRKVFEGITSMKVRVFRQIVGQKFYSFAEFVTLIHPEFTRFYKLFYPNHRKIVPKNIGEILVDPLSLAVWFMDDGTAEYAGLSIQTHSFSEEEVNKLLKVIKGNFGLDCWKKRNKGKWIVYLPKRSLAKLSEIIGEYVLPDFQYKLLPYTDRPRRDCTPDPAIAGYDTVRTAQ
jgi:hypothetical protein